MNVTTGKQVTEKLKQSTPTSSAQQKGATSSAQQNGASDMAHIVLTFDSNRLASALFGQFDENLAYIEQKLGVDVRSKGNQLDLRGTAAVTEQARIVLDHLYSLLQKGHDLSKSDVDGALRMAANITPESNDQLSLPTLESKARLSAAQISTRKKTIFARTPTQDAYMRAMERSELVFGTGPAGTGKTYLAVAHAAMLLERGLVERIILSRPAVEAGERLGFLPGDMKEKVDPYLRPLYDALYDMIPADKVERALAAGVIEIAPLAFMRGRTLAHAAVILDEAQNTTTMQMKMFLTRLGQGSRMIITGDPSQIDLPSGQKSGLVEALEILGDVENIVTVRFSDKDVVRHPMVAAIVRAYEKRGAARTLRQQRTITPDEAIQADIPADSEAGKTSA
ncbi:hypothetical protein MP213Fo_14150 [Pseudochrobactrum sp. MP213Fo]